MRRSVVGVSDSPKSSEILRDLFYGIAPAHVRLLCENQWDGGRSYTPQSVGDMTPDQVYLLLCDKRLLRLRGKRTVTMAPSEAIPVSADGRFKGRTEDGQVFYASRGESLASRMIREENEKLKNKGSKKDRKQKLIDSQQQNSNESIPGGVSSGPELNSQKPT